MTVKQLREALIAAASQYDDYEVSVGVAGIEAPLRCGVVSTDTEFEAEVLVLSDEGMEDGPLYLFAESVDDEEGDDDDCE